MNTFLTIADDLRYVVMAVFAYACWLMFVYTTAWAWYHGRDVVTKSVFKRLQRKVEKLKEMEVK